MIVKAGVQQQNESTAKCSSGAAACSMCLRGQTCRLRRSSLASLFVRYSSTRVVARRASCSAVSSLGSSTAGAGGAGATDGAAEGAAGSLAGDGVLHGASNECLPLKRGCHPGLTEERWHWSGMTEYACCAQPARLLSHFKHASSPTRRTGREPDAATACACACPQRSGAAWAQRGHAGLARGGPAAWPQGIACGQVLIAGRPVHGPDGPVHSIIYPRPLWWPPVRAEHFSSDNF